MLCLYVSRVDILTKNEVKLERELKVCYWLQDMGGPCRGSSIFSISSLLEAREGEGVIETCSPTADLKRLYREAGRCGVFIYFF